MRRPSASARRFRSAALYAAQYPATDRAELHGCDLYVRGAYRAAIGGRLRRAPHRGSRALDDSWTPVPAAPPLAERRRGGATIAGRRCLPVDRDDLRVSGRARRGPTAALEHVASSTSFGSVPRFAVARMAVSSCARFAGLAFAIARAQSASSSASQSEASHASGSSSLARSSASSFEKSCLRLAMRNRRGDPSASGSDGDRADQRRPALTRLGSLRQRPLTRGSVSAP